VIGHCSGGRQAFLAACSLPLDAAVDCYGAFVTVEPPESLGLRATPLLPIADRLSCPLLGLFGEEDRYPSPEQTAELEAVLTKHGKTFEFHTFEGAGHAFFAVDRVSYRPQVAVEGWKYTFTWFDRYLGA
jgi:carboxymethylenebutenolidase